MDWDRKHVSIEPIMKFDMGKFVAWIKDIDPEMLCVGYANRGLKLPEPSFEKVLRLMRKLAEFTQVEPKEKILVRMNKKQLYKILKKSGWNYREQSSLDSYSLEKRSGG